MRLFFIALVIILLDQASKLWIMDVFALYQSKEIIPGFFNLIYITNTGAAFGILAGAPNSWRQLFFVSVALIALGAIVLLYRRLADEHPLNWIGLGLIAGGAVGNLIDRIRLGSVVDFLDFYYQSWHWPAFNIADSAITVGTGLFLLASFLEGKKTDTSV